MNIQYGRFTGPKCTTGPGQLFTDRNTALSVHMTSSSKFFCSTSFCYYLLLQYAPHIFQSGFQRILYFSKFWSAPVLQMSMSFIVNINIINCLDAVNPMFQRDTFYTFHKYLWYDSMTGIHICLSALLAKFPIFVTFRTIAGLQRYQTGSCLNITVPLLSSIFLLRHLGHFRNEFFCLCTPSKV